MFDLRGKKGAYLNNYAQPDEATFKQRASQCDYLVIKYGMAKYEQLAREVGKPWLAEIYPYRSTAAADAQKLANQAKQPGCVGAVVNMESGSAPGVADWDKDDGTATTLFVKTFVTSAPGVPLYASIDTRDYRPTKPYQDVLRAACDGVFPMMFPKDFQQTTPTALAAVLPGCLSWAARGKPIVVTFQGFDNIGPATVRIQVACLNQQLEVDGINIYTIGHASEAEWLAFATATFHREEQMTSSTTPPPAPVSQQAGLLELRIKWLESMTALALAGDVTKVRAFIYDWANLANG